MARCAPECSWLRGIFARRFLRRAVAALRPRTVDLYRWLLKKHIAPYLGGVAVGRLSTPMIREWRAKLLASGVSVSVTAKSYRLLRAVFTTAVEEDKILPGIPAASGVPVMKTHPSARC